METKTLGRGKTLGILIGLYLAYAASFTATLMSPVTSIIFREFADRSEVELNFLLSGSTLFTIAASLLIGVLARRISKKKIQIACTAVYSIGNLLMLFGTSFPMFLAGRMCCGIGSGAAMTTIPGIICQIWPEGKERTKYISYMQTAGLLIGVVFSLFSGIIADRSSNWHNVFWLGIVSVFSFFAAVFVIPDTPPEREIQTDSVKTAGGAGAKKKINLPFLLVIFAGQFMMNGLYCVMYYLSDLYVSQTGIGTAALTGLKGAVASGSGALIALVATAIYMKLRRWTAPGTWLWIGACFLMLGLYPSAVVFVVGCGFACAGQTVNNIYYQMKFTELAPPDRVSMFMSINTFATTFSMFLSPYVPSLFKKLFGAQNMQESFLWLGIIMLAIAVISVILIFVVRDEHDKPQKKIESVNVNT